MRDQLRQYFERSRTVREVNDDSSLLATMSPLLQGTVAYAANRRWIERIWYLRSMGSSRDSKEFVASLASALTLRAYIAEERAALGLLYVIRRGRCVKNWRFFKAGDVFGDDIILDSEALLDHSQGVAITFLEAYTISRDALDAAANRFPQARVVIERAAVRLRMQRALLVYVFAVLTAGFHPRPPTSTPPSPASLCPLCSALPSLPSVLLLLCPP